MIALRLDGSLITFFSVHLSGETSKFSNSQLMSDIGIPLKLLSSEKYELIMKLRLLNNNNNFVF